SGLPRAAAEADGDGRPAADLALERDAGALGVGVTLDEREAEAHAARGARLLAAAALERREEARAVFRRDADALVGDRKRDGVAVAPHGDEHVLRLRLRAVLDRVVDEVGDDRPHEPRVEGHERQPVLDLDAQRHPRLRALRLARRDRLTYG